MLACLSQAWIPRNGEILITYTEDRQIKMIRILLVEKDPDLQRQIHAVLTNQAFKLSTVSDGIKALDRLRGSDHDLVLLNATLPIASGLEILQRVQKQWPNLPVVIYSAVEDGEISAQAIRLGAKDYFPLQEVIDGDLNLQERIRYVLREHQVTLYHYPREARYRQLVEIFLQITSTLEINPLVESLLESSRKLLRSNAAMVFILDSERPEIVFASTRGISFQEKLEGPVEGKGVLRRLAKLETVLMEEAEDHPDFAETPPHHPSIHNRLLIPFERGDLRGFIGVANHEERYTREDEEFLWSLGFQAATVIQNAKLHEEVRQLARTDSLTGLLNHREMQQRLQEEIDRFNRYGHPFSILMIDIDRFKCFNDAFGHALGDQILRRVARQIQETLRSVDLTARYGGEEFVVILPETAGEGAMKAAEKIRLAIYENPTTAPMGERIRSSVSIGIASFPMDGKDRATLLRAADRALYLAKEGGRNQVCTSRQNLRSAQGPAGKLTRLMTDPLIRSLADLAKSHESRLPCFKESVFAVSQYALLLAEGLGLSQEEREDLWIAATFHNIGSLFIPDEILAKPDRLEGWEEAIVRTHPRTAQSILLRIPSLTPAAKTILHHHESYDGTGYPGRLQGEEIPVLSRILSVSEAYFALISPRPYRKPFPRGEAQAILRQRAGKQFDPDMVETFIRLLSENEALEEKETAGGC
jgi:diguanylate cyclase (GGDEF)-like protein